ncbi:MAG: arginine deiminase-related protein [Bacteroidota bacterium]
MTRQNAACILMVRPANLDYNSVTAPNNPFQDQAALQMDTSLKIEKSRAEFDFFVELLRREGITIKVFEDSPQPRKTDAVFPNNWVSFHADGRVILYPMFAPNRRSERRPDLLATLAEEFAVKETQLLGKTASVFRG